MDLEIRKYKNKNEIIINCFDTWTNSMQKLINENYDTIRKYRKREKEIFELKKQYKRENKFCDPFNLNNEYYNNLDKLKKIFLDILLTENKPLICFHASRYTDKEKNRILKFGLTTSSKDNLFNRIQNLLNDGYIDKNEFEFLKKHNLLIKPDNMRENQIWVTLGNVNISYSLDSDLFSIYNNYGGEIQYSCIEKSLLGNKLNSLSKPFLVILKLYPTQIVKYGLSGLVDNIFSNVEFNNSEDVDYEFFTTEGIVPIEDIIQIDGDSKIKY